MGILFLEWTYVVKKRLYNIDIEPACEYCSLGRAIAGSDEILCMRKGPIPAIGQCSKFVYDPLKRTPKPKALLPKYDMEEFKL